MRARRDEILSTVIRLAWETASYTDLIARVTDVLGAHPEIAGCFIGRMGDGDVFHYEALAGSRIEPYLAQVDRIRADYIGSGREIPSRNPIDRALASGCIEHAADIATDALMPPWRDAAVANGLRSCVAIPIQAPEGGAVVIVGLYSALRGIFASDDYAAFLAQLQSLLTFSIARLDSQEGPMHTVGHVMRQRWSALIKTDALEMYYQPLLDLKTRRIAKVEALARLRDGEALLSPHEFFSALASDDFFNLYAYGLEKALSQRDRWLLDGLDMQLSVNIPVQALGDGRYYDATIRVLREHDCPPAMLTLEILETDEIPAGIDVAAELARYKALGVDLAEDDLGAGHSSLMRLRELPFDSIKIDRSLVTLDDRNSADVLHFIYQLTRLGHSLGKSVVVEGVEDEDLLEAIAILGADAAQGYVIARPMPGSDVAQWIARHPTRAAPVRPRNILSQMARLLIWEECLYLLRDEASTTGGLTDIDGPMQPFSDVDAGIQRIFVLTAVTRGPGSPEYRQAREQLVQALIDKTARP